MKLLPDFVSHVTSVRDLLKAAGFTVYVGDVLDANPPIPYVMLQAATGLPDAVNLAVDQVEVSESLNVTTVDTTPLNAMRTNARVRNALAGAVLSIPGRTCFPLRLEGAQAVAVDRNVTLTDSRTHPAYAVDEWRVTSTPTEE